MISRSPLGTIPTGTANAMAHQLHHAEIGDYCTMIGCAALAAALGTTTKVDMFKVSDNGTKFPLYALSCFGWGMAALIVSAVQCHAWRL
jgi:diacylglycerol kinase family enzyme